ncbi:MAG: SGNH/GDSL hydrolase family protein [Candidatus Rokuibacteriota bacterium]
MSQSPLSRTKIVVFSLAPLLVLLCVLEVTGRIVYPFDPDSRARIQTERDPRAKLSYLGSPQVSAESIIEDIYRFDHRYLPFLGWIGAPNTDLPTLKANELGFRDRPVEPRKPNELRILLLGGSTAWGFGASSTEATVAGVLERLLNDATAKSSHRVMSGAFTGWSSRQERVVLLEFFGIFQPDLVIALTGYNDLVTMARFGAGKFLQRPESVELANAVEANLRPMDTFQAIRKVVGTLGVWRLVVYLRERLTARASSGRRVAYERTVAEREMARIADLYSAMAEFLDRRGGRLMVALQPELYTTGKALTREEMEVRQRYVSRFKDIEPVFRRYRADLLRALLESRTRGFSVMDLQTVFDGHTRPVFLDDCHLNDEGYRTIARALKAGIGIR